MHKNTKLPLKEDIFYNEWPTSANATGKCKSMKITDNLLPKGSNIKHTIVMYKIPVQICTKYGNHWKVIDITRSFSYLIV